MSYFSKQSFFLKASQPFRQHQHRYMEQLLRIVLIQIAVNIRNCTRHRKKNVQILTRIQEVYYERLGGEKTSGGVNVWATLRPICPHCSLNITNWSAGGVLCSVVSLYSVFLRFLTLQWTQRVAAVPPMRLALKSVWFSLAVLPHFSYPLSPCQGVIAARRSR